METVKTATKRADITDLEVCKAVKQAREDDTTTLEILKASTGAPKKVIIAAVQRTFDAGFLECGVSLRTAWLTQKGKDLVLQAKCGIPTTGEDEAREIKGGAMGILTCSRCGQIFEDETEAEDHLTGPLCEKRES